MPVPAATPASAFFAPGSPWAKAVAADHDYVPAELCGTSLGPIQELDGHAGKDMSDLYDKIEEDVHSAGSGRNDVALGFN
jgi:hypothetical protein